MYSEADDFTPGHEAYPEPELLSASIIDFPNQTAVGLSMITDGELVMSLEVGEETIEVDPQNALLERDPEDPSRFNIFHKHKKALIGTFTTAAVLAAVAGISYSRKKK